MATRTWLLATAALLAAAAGLVVSAAPSPAPPSSELAGPSGDDVRAERWVRALSTVPGSQQVGLLFALRHPDGLREQLDAVVKRVAYPSSPDYGRYLSKAEIDQLAGASEQSIESVKQEVLRFDRSARFELTGNRDALIVETTVAATERIFGVRLETWECVYSRRRVVRSALPHRIPAALAPHVDVVTGVSDFKPRGRRAAQQQQRGEQRPSPGRARSASAPERAALDAASAADSDSDSASRRGASSAPTIARAGSRGGARAITVNYTPVCADGMTSAELPPCKSSPDGPVIAVYVSVASATDVRPVNEVVKVSLGESDCAVTKGVTGCAVTVDENVAYYEQYLVGLNVEYSSGRVSAFGSWGFPVISTPAVTPHTIASHYGLPDRRTITNPNATQLVAEFEEQYYDPANLAMFLHKFGLPTSTEVELVGPNDPSKPGVEAELDLQYIVGMAPGAKTWFWSIKQNSTFQVDDILAWAVAVGKLDAPPLVSSLSYGMPADKVDKYLGQGYMARCERELAKLAARGLTVVIACGDAGAGDLGPPPSETSCAKLHPDWPSNSPFVLAVGTTFITPSTSDACYSNSTDGGVNCLQDPLGDASVSMDRGFFWTTGGGFSDTEPRPKYQDDAVEAYLRSGRGLPTKGLFNQAGRAYPDVVIVGHNIEVAVNGSFKAVDGTSASAPIWAGLLTQLNQALLDAGKPPVGLVNPLLYDIWARAPAAFVDVVAGDNRCGTADSTPRCCPSAYSAVPGFDGVSGLGVPNFERLLEAVLKYH